MKIKLAIFLMLATLSQVSSIAQAETTTPASDGIKAGQQNTVTILDGKATIVLPEGFTRMTEEQITEKYVAANPWPKEAWYLDKGESVITLTFSQPFPDKKLVEQHVPKLAEIMKQQMVGQNPVLSTKKVNGHTVSRLESMGNDVSGDGTTVYSILQLSSLDDRVMMATFHVTAQLKDEYYPIGEAALDSLSYRKP